MPYRPPQPPRQRVRAAVATGAVLGGGLLAAPAATATSTEATDGPRVLTVRGGNLDDRIVVSRDAVGQIAINGRAVAIHGAPATVTNLDLVRVLGAAGNDTITLDETNGPLPQAALYGGTGHDFIAGGAEKDLLAGGRASDVLEGGRGDEQLLGGSGNDFVDGNQGSDAARMGDGNDTFQWDPGDGSDVLEGQSGTDAMVFNGADVGERFDIAANGGRVRFTRDLGGITMDLNRVERIDTNALGGPDAFTAQDLSGTDVTSVRINEAGSSGAPDGIADRLTLTATPGADRVIVRGRAASGVSVTGLATTVEIRGTDPADGLEIDAGAGNDALDASQLRSNTVTFGADGGDGNDRLVGSAGDDALHGGAGNDVIVGGPGLDVLDGGSGHNVLVQ